MTRSCIILFALLEGALVMAVELLAARMLAPWYGSDLLAWASVIGVTLFALAAGYYAGGGFSGNKESGDWLYYIVLASSLFIMSMPFLSGWLPPRMDHFQTVGGCVLLSIILIGPPVGMLGAIPPLLVSHFTRQAEVSGRAAGMVFALSTIGGILSAFFMGFVVIPGYGIIWPALLAGLIPGALCLLLLLMRGRTVVLLYLIPAVAALVFAKENTISSVKNTNRVKVLHQSEGMLGQLLIADIKFGSAVYRAMFVNRMGQTFIDQSTGRSRWSYVDYVTSLASGLPEHAEVLLLGLGGGTVANQLRNILDYSVDAVELDPRIAEAAGKYFALDKNVHVFRDDARHFLRKTNRRYDMIIFDLYRGESPPAHVLCLEAFRGCVNLLKPGGLIAVNFNGFLKRTSGSAGRSIFMTLQAAGMDVKVLPTWEEEVKYRNNLFLASPETGQVERIAGSVRLPLNRQGETVTIASQWLSDDLSTFGKSVVFTDDNPILERYNIIPARIWRKEYTLFYTRALMEEGVGLFR